MNLRPSVFLALGLILGVEGQSSYCSFTPHHALCLPAGIGANCGTRIPVRGIDRGDKNAIVEWHNKLRATVALGQEGRASNGLGQPPAADMMTLEWDGELSKIAQRHADRCRFQHDCPNCRKVVRFDVGQNLFISFQSNFDARVDWIQAIQSWYDEVSMFDSQHIQPFRFSLNVGHYTQMLWSETTKIGCGLTMFKEGFWWKKLYTCNYGPVGNVLEGRMYSVGQPCSQCPSGTICSVQYQGLCEPISSSSVSISNSSFSLRSKPTSNVLLTTSAMDTVPFDRNDEENNIALMPNSRNTTTPPPLDFAALVDLFRQWKGEIPSHPNAASRTADVPPATSVITDHPIRFPNTSAANNTNHRPVANRSLPPANQQQLQSTGRVFPARVAPVAFHRLHSVPELRNLAGADPDLRRFLQRASPDAHVIRTDSLANVPSIISSLPSGSTPIVIVRSKGGQLTQFHPMSLQPMTRRLNT